MPRRKCTRKKGRYETLCCRFREDLPVDDQQIVPVGGKRRVEVFNLDGQFYALKNICSHKGGPLCRGRLCPHATSNETYHIGCEHENEIIKCSWHQCEFDIKTGQALYDQHLRMKTYLVKVEESDIVIYDG